MLPPKLKTKCIEVLKGLQTHEHGWVFQTPIDPVELDLPDYFDIIKHHMDLGTIQKKLESGSYHAIEDFKDDCRLTFDNAMKYNEEQTVVHEMAKTLKKMFEADYKRLTKDETKASATTSGAIQQKPVLARRKWPEAWPYWPGGTNAKESVNCNASAGSEAKEAGAGESVSLSFNVAGGIHDEDSSDDGRSVKQRRSSS